MSCTILPIVSEPDHAPDVPHQGLTRFIHKPNILQKLSAVRETDARTALKRGLKEYIEQLIFMTESGREIRLARVFDTWAEPEQTAIYPSAIVYAKGEGSYDASSFVPVIDPDCKVGEEGYVIKTSEYETDLTVEVWCTDPEERIGFATMFEDAMVPVEWMYGVRLELPHYHNVRATYELVSNNFPDSAEEAHQRNRLLTLTVRGRVPVVRFKTLPTAKPRLQLEVVDGVEC